MLLFLACQASVCVWMRVRAREPDCTQQRDKCATMHHSTPSYLRGVPTSVMMCCLSSGLLVQHLPMSRPARQDVWRCSRASMCVSPARTRSRAASKSRRSARSPRETSPGHSHRVAAPIRARLPARPVGRKHVGRTQKPTRAQSKLLLACLCSAAGAAVGPPARGPCPATQQHRAAVRHRGPLLSWSAAASMAGQRTEGACCICVESHLPA